MFFVQFPTSTAWHPCYRVLAGRRCHPHSTHGQQMPPGARASHTGASTEPIISACWWASGHKHRQSAPCLGFPECTDNASGKNQCRRQNLQHCALASMQKQRRFKRSLFCLFQILFLNLKSIKEVRHGSWYL